MSKAVATVAAITLPHFGVVSNLILVNLLQREVVTSYFLPWIPPRSHWHFFLIVFKVQWCTYVYMRMYGVVFFKCSINLLLVVGCLEYCQEIPNFNMLPASNRQGSDYQLFAHLGGSAWSGTARTLTKVGWGLLDRSCSLTWDQSMFTQLTWTW